MSDDKSIDEELDRLTTIYERGGGIGEPGLEHEVGRRIELLKHRQAQGINKRNNRLAALNVFLTAVNILILVYQIFFR